MGTNCYRKGYEHGPWYELKILREHIAGRDARGEDTTFYRELYESWITYPEFARADKENRAKGFYGTLSPMPDKKDGGTNEKHGKRDVTPLKMPEFEDLPVVLKHPGGRPRKTGEVSRTTTWRRDKENQGVLV